MTNAYHEPDPGPDGLCRVEGCGRTSDSHLKPVYTERPLPPLFELRREMHRRASDLRPRSATVKVVGRYGTSGECADAVAADVADLEVLPAQSLIDWVGPIKGLELYWEGRAGVVLVASDQVGNRVWYRARILA